MKSLNKILILKIGIVLVFSIGVISGGIVLYENSSILTDNKFTNNSFFNATSSIFYKSIWQSKYEKIFLEQELELSNIKKEQAETWAEEESVARVEAEEETQKEIVKKNQAEARAKQEEFEKKLREEELADKEAGERKMSADNDNDGLTYREEQNLGSSDWSTDSDGDGIQDNLDLHPAGGGRYLAQTFSWNYGDYNWEWTENLHEDWVEYYGQKSRGEHGVGYITSEDPFIKKIANWISRKANSKSDIRKTWLAVSFVQNLPYVDDVYTGYDEYPKYPVETFFEKNGDCEDMSYLAASVIDAMDIGAVLVMLPGHMAVGVWMDCDTSGTYYNLNGKCYYYVETTNNTYSAGDIPADHKNDRATLIEIPSGKRTYVYPSYNEPCTSSEAFPGYYYSAGEYFKDNSCLNSIACIPDEGLYYKPVSENFFWDRGCSQIVIDGCTRDPDYTEYFTNGYNYYYDSRCRDEADVCIFAGDGYYFDGEDLYWNSSCTQEVATGCSKSSYYSGYFFDGSNYYYDYRCTQPGSPY